MAHKYHGYLNCTKIEWSCNPRETNLLPCIMQEKIPTTHPNNTVPVTERISGSKYDTLGYEVGE